MTGSGLSIGVLLFITAQGDGVDGHLDTAPVAEFGM